MDQGNVLFKEKKLNEAIEQYTMALAYNDDESVRALMNRSQAYLNVNQCELCINDCNMLLEKYGQRDEKTFYRKCNALYAMKNMEESFKTLLIGIFHNPQSKVLHNLRNKFENFTDLNHVLTSMPKICSYFMRSTRQLKNVVREKYHDNWELEDYFDRENEFRKFDVPVPPELFVANEQLVNDQTLYYNNLASTVAFSPAEQQVYTFDDNYENNSQLLALSLYYKYSQGIYRSSGFPNAYCAYALLLSTIRSKKEIYVLTSSTQCEKVESVGIKCGNVRCKSVTWYTIGKGNVIVRDYDPHVWLSFKLTNGSEIDVDFVACQFNYFTYHKETKLPLRIFSPEINQLEKSKNNDEWRAVYITKKQYWNEEALEYIHNKYHDDYKVESTHTDKNIEHIAKLMHEAILKTIV